MLREFCESSFRYETKLYESLETVADSTHEAIPFMKKPFNLAHYRRVSEKRRDELSRAIRLISS